MKLIFSVALLLAAVLAFAEEPVSLPLDAYLGQVKAKNEAYRGAVEEREGAKERTEEKDVLLAPTLFTNVTLRRDAKLPTLPLFSYRRLDTQNYSLGVMKQTSFGLQAKLSYEVDYFSYVESNLAATAAAQGFPLTFYDARPVIELSQSLWQNGFGSATRATQELIEHQAQAERFGAEAQAKAKLLEAEAAYWRLAVAREAVQIGETAIEAAKSIHDYVQNRAKMNLGDRADTLQAKAGLEARRLELKAAKDDERAAARSFNALRNVASTEVTEALAPIDWDRLEAIAVPADHASRPDVKAAEAQAKASAANSRLQAEKDKPTLDVFGQYAMNGRDVSVADASSAAITQSRPTFTAGLRFLMPLDFGAVESARRGAIRQEQAAAMVYRQKALDQEQQWSDLVEKINDARERFKMARTIEDAQKQKLVYERTRLKTGRTTTYQVLLFEGDYSQAALTRTRAAAEVLGLAAQLKMYDPAEAPSPTSKE